MYKRVEYVQFWERNAAVFNDYKYTVMQRIWIKLMTCCSGILLFGGDVGNWQSWKQ